MSHNLESPPGSDGSSDAPKPPKGLVYLASTTFAIVCVLGLILFMIVSPRRTPREAARRHQCMDNLRQIALGLKTYADEHSAFPPAYTIDAHGKPLHSWRTLILPYIGQAELFQ